MRTCCALMSPRCPYPPRCHDSDGHLCPAHWEAGLELDASAPLAVPSNALFPARKWACKPPRIHAVAYHDKSTAWACSNYRSRLGLRKIRAGIAGGACWWVPA